MTSLVSLLGMAVLIGLALLLCENRKAIRLRTVGGAFLIQLAIGAFVLYTPIGIKVLASISTQVQRVIDCSTAGISFLFGGLVSDQMFTHFGDQGFVFAFRVLPTIIFFSSRCSIT